MVDLSGQVAIVTGAGRGIGRALARALAGAGARVALTARSAGELAAVEAEIRAAAGEALALPADVTAPAAVDALVAHVEATLGPVDLLVNNAGSFYAIGPAWDVDPERWWTDVTVNLRGPFLCCRAVLPGMVARDRGRVLNVIGGGTGSPFPYGSGYASSKAALMRFTECVAAELRAAGAAVAVFAMGPGLVRTRLTEFQLESPEGQQWLPRIAEAFAAGRDVAPTRAAALALALASGRFDRLAGRCFGHDEDLDETLADEHEILRHDRKTLRFR
jgi:NAD(P)-dependent dehydrogenase (short-subunit alcohol dehydrogenase family)